jgi:hypothetical protein
MNPELAHVVVICVWAQSTQVRKERNKQLRRVVIEKYAKILDKVNDNPIKCKTVKQERAVRSTSRDYLL